MELSTPRLADRSSVAISAAEILMEMTATEWETTGIAAATQLRAKRADSPLLLAVTQAALDPRAEKSRETLAAVIRELRNSAWLVDVCLNVGSVGSLGILSLGENTMRFIQTYVDATGREPELFAAKRSVARGLGNLDLPVFVGDPRQANLLLVPINARHEHRVWSTPDLLEIMNGATGQVRTTEHPLANLSPTNRLSYRPSAGLIDAVARPE